MSSPNDTQPRIILASTSIYRRQLLQRLALPFHCRPPQVDETPLPGESARTVARRLALEKARSIAGHHANAIVIGSDQVADCDGALLGKPGDAASAVRQLLDCRNKAVIFWSAIAVIQQARGIELRSEVATEVRFRHFSEAEAVDYVQLDQPLDCAGAFKSECAGPWLMDSMTSSDPTAIVGMPLISLSRALRECGVTLPARP